MELIPIGVEFRATLLSLHELGRFSFNNFCELFEE